MSVHTDDAGVSVASVISSVTEVFNGDERSELIKWGVDVPGPCLPPSFVVSFTNAYVKWGHVSSFTSWSWFLLHQLQHYTHQHALGIGRGFCKCICHTSCCSQYSFYVVNYQTHVLFWRVCSPRACIWCQQRWYSECGSGYCLAWHKPWDGTVYATGIPLLRLYISKDHITNNNNPRAVVWLGVVWAWERHYAYFIQRVYNIRDCWKHGTFVLNAYERVIHMYA